MITGTQIIERVNYLLNDVSNVQWTAAEKLAWLNDGRREMATRLSGRKRLSSKTSLQWLFTKLVWKKVGRSPRQRAKFITEVSKNGNSILNHASQ